MRLFLICIMMMIAAPAWCGDDFGMITGLKGTVTIKRPKGRTITLNRDKHLLRIVRIGEEIDTGADGWLKVADLQGSRIFEIKPESIVVVTEGSLKTVKGKVDTHKGFPLPTRVGDRPIGAVILSSTMRGGEESCLGKIRPLNTASSRQIKRIAWRNYCDDKQRTTFSIIDPAGNSVFRTITNANFVDIPDSTLTEGIRYTVNLEQPGTEKRISGFLRVLNNKERARIDQLRSASQTEGLSARFDFLLYLIANELYGEARDEVSKLRKEFPDNENLAGLATYLSSSW